MSVPNVLPWKARRLLGESKSTGDMTNSWCQLWDGRCSRLSDMVSGVPCWPWLPVVRGVPRLDELEHVSCVNIRLVSCTQAKAIRNALYAQGVRGIALYHVPDYFVECSR